MDAFEAADLVAAQGRPGELHVLVFWAPPYGSRAGGAAAGEAAGR